MLGKRCRTAGIVRPNSASASGEVAETPGLSEQPDNQTAQRRIRDLSLHIVALHPADRRTLQPRRSRQPLNQRGLPHTRIAQNQCVTRNPFPHALPRLIELPGTPPCDR